MPVVIARTIILYFAVVIVLRLMGKREIGQLQPTELVVALMVADLAAIPMQNTGIPLINGLLPILVLLILESAIAYLNLKSERARALFCGIPSILIRRGKIDAAELSRQNYNLNDLVEQLRSKGYANIGAVEYAVLETNGQLSVLPKAQRRPVNPADLGINPAYEDLPVTLILDGRLNRTNLERIGKDEAWLARGLALQGLPISYSRILFAVYDPGGKLLAQAKAGETG